MRAPPQIRPLERCNIEKGRDLVRPALDVRTAGFGKCDEGPVARQGVGWIRLMPRGASRCAAVCTR